MSIVTHLRMLRMSLMGLLCHRTVHTRYQSNPNVIFLELSYNILFDVFIDIVNTIHVPFLFLLELNLSISLSSDSSLQFYVRLPTDLSHRQLVHFSTPIHLFFVVHILGITSFRTEESLSHPFLWRGWHSLLFSTRDLSFHAWTHPFRINWSILQSL